MICFSELATQGGIFLDQRVESISDNGKTPNVNTVRRRPNVAVGRSANFDFLDNSIVNWYIVILFEIDLSQLRTALQSILSGGSKRSLKPSRNVEEASAIMLASAVAADVSTTVMKLAKRNGGTMCPIPCLCLEATCMGPGGSITVHHAIPIRLMRPAEMK
jgi:hypothetical protein